MSIDGVVTSQAQQLHCTRLQSQCRDTKRPVYIDVNAPGSSLDSIRLASPPIVEYSHQQPPPAYSLTSGEVKPVTPNS